VRIIIGVILILIGIVAIIFGDKKLNVREGSIMKFFPPAQSRWRMMLLKYVLGCTFVYIGLRVIFDPWWE
jgi:cytochrome c biogenesis protein CcdA